MGGGPSHLDTFDPKPALTLGTGHVASMDGVAAADFDMIDVFIARYHLDPEVALEAMAMPSLEVARMLVDMNVPRTELVRLARGMTPAKLAASCRVGQTGRS